MFSHTKKINLFMLFWFTLLGATQAQTPGGVTANPALWMKANAGITGTTTISAWQNQATNANHASQPINTHQPTLFNQGINFNPSISFDGNDNYLALEDIHFTTAQQIQNLVVFTVFKTDNNTGGTFDNWSFLDFDRSEYFNFFVRPDNGELGFGWAVREGGSNTIYDNYSNAGGLNDNNPHLGVAIFDGNVVEDTKIRVDGQEQYSQDNVSTGVYMGTGTQRFGFIGDGSEADAFNGSRNNIHYSGEIAENIYFYNQSLSNTDIDKIESYLAIKYGLSLTHNYVSSADVVLWDYTNNTTYSHYVVGIGRDDASALTQVRSKNANSAAGIVLEEESGTITDQNFILVGSNGQSGLNTTTVPPGYINQSNRIWKAQETGAISTVKIQFLLNRLGVPNTGNVADYALFYNDNDDDFTSGASLETTATLSGDTLTFSGIDLNDGYFALASIVVPPFGTSANAALWFSADQGVTTSGGNVSFWQERSTGVNNAVQSTSSDQPELLATGMNCQPALSFDGDDYLAIQGKQYANTGEISSMAVFTVFKTDFNGSSNNDNWAFLDYDRSEYFNFFVRGDDGRLGFANTNESSEIRDNYTTTNGLNDNQPHLGVAIYDGAEVLDTKIRIDGIEDIAVDRETTGTHIGSGNYVRYGFIGDGSEASTFDGSRNNLHYEGEIAEVIYFENQTLTQGDILRIESYLAFKYGLTLQHNYVDSEGTVYWDITQDTAFNNEILGIGRDQSNSLHIRQNKSSASGAIMTLGHIDIAADNAANTNDISTDHSYMVWGHNGGALDTTGVTDLPIGVVNRIARTWLVQETGTMGTIKMRFDVSNLVDVSSPYVLSQLSSVMLLVDTDATFSSGAATVSPVAVDPVAGTVDFDVDFTNFTGYYFSLGTMFSLDQLLPVELLSFDANVLPNNQVELHWSVAGEIDFEKYVVERSSDIQQWEAVGEVKATESQVFPKQYTLRDHFPYEGISYYRLREVNLDGSTKQIAREVVLLETSREDIVVFPNPTHRITFVEGSQKELEVIRVFTIQGQEVTHLVGSAKVSETKWELNLEKLPQGIYVIRTRTNTKTLQKN